MGESLTLFDVLICVSFGAFFSIVAYLLWYTHKLVERNDVQTQKSLDALLALANTKAAQVAANMSNVREQTTNFIQPSSEELAKVRQRAEDDRMLEEISRATVLSAEQEKFLQGYPDAH
jgi:Tfp pilus assembly protein PilO